MKAQDSQGLERQNISQGVLAHSVNRALRSKAAFDNFRSNVATCSFAVLAASTLLAVPRVSAQAFPAIFDLSSMKQSDGIVLDGIGNVNILPIGASSVGDINGDGLDDIAVATTHYDFAGYVGSRREEAYIVFGREQGFPSNLNVNSLAQGDGSIGFVAYTDTAGYIRTAVSSAGDVNGDGLDDLIIGSAAWLDDLSYREGRAFVIYGQDSVSMPPEFDLQSLAQGDGSQGFVLYGSNVGDEAG